MSVATGLNIVPIVIGALVALCALIAWFSTDPEDSALRQTVSALWLLAALVGLAIAALGLVGAMVTHAIERNRANDSAG